MEGLVRPGFCQRNCLHCGKSLCEKNVCFTHLSLQREWLEILVAYRVKKGDVDSSQLQPCQDTILLSCFEGYLSYTYMKNIIWTINRHRKHRGTWMYDRRWADSIFAGCRVYLLRTSCKCSRACKALDCQCVAYALKCLRHVESAMWQHDWRRLWREFQRYNGWRWKWLWRWQKCLKLQKWVSF